MWSFVVGLFRMALASRGESGKITKNPKLKYFFPPETVSVILGTLHQANVCLKLFELFDANDAPDDSSD